MKNIFAGFLVLVFISCGANTREPSGADSANAIDDRRSMRQDTDVAPFPDGYAPPNTEVDTSKRVKDSIQSANEGKKM